MNPIYWYIYVIFLVLKLNQDIYIKNCTHDHGRVLIMQLEELYYKGVDTQGIVAVHGLMRLSASSTGIHCSFRSARRPRQTYEPEEVECPLLTKPWR